MEAKLIFLLPHQAHQAYELIQERMDWMEQNHIHQWVRGEYDKAYPESYFLVKAEAHQIVGLEEDGELLASAVILNEDPRWGKRGDKALYIHCLAGNPAVHGAGRLLLKRIEEYAKENGYQYTRLDSMRTSSKLYAYYTNLGYAKVGEGAEPYYQFNLYQKELKDE